MNVIVQSKTMVITEALRNFVTRQTRKFIRRGPKISSVTVFLDLIKRKKNDVQATSAKLLIDVPGKNLVVQEKAKDMYQAIHEATQTALRQLEKTKPRRTLRHLIVRA